MAVDLTGIELKIGRAESQLADLKQSIKSTFNRDAYTFSVEYEPETANHVYRIHNIPDADPEWSVIVGEILFNLRSALDHLAWQLVILDGQKPGKKTQFPIRDVPPDEKGDPSGVNLVPPLKSPDILRALNECQPYNGVLGDPHPIGRHGLWQLNKLNNIDKHRLLLVVVHIIKAERIWWQSDPDNPRRVSLQRVSTCPLKDGSPVAWFDLHGTEPPPDLDRHLNIAVAINEPRVPGIRVTPLPNLMENLCFWVRQYVLKRHFGEMLGMPYPWGS